MAAGTTTRHSGCCKVCEASQCQSVGLGMPKGWQGCRGRRRKGCHCHHRAGTPARGLAAEGCAVLAVALRCSRREEGRMLLPVPRTRLGAGTADLRVMMISRPGKQPCCHCQCRRRQASGWVSAALPMPKGTPEQGGTADEVRAAAAGQRGQAEGAGLTRLTPSCQERVPGCIPAFHFGSFQPFPS